MAALELGLGQAWAHGDYRQLGTGFRSSDCRNSFNSVPCLNSRCLFMLELSVTSCTLSQMSSLPLLVVFFLIFSVVILFDLLHLLIL